MAETGVQGMRELPGGQQGDQWHENRMGRITASRMNDLMDYTQKKVEGAKRKKYRFELLAERTTGMEQDNRPPTPAMQWGSDQEQFALRVYEKSCDVFLIPVGFVLHPIFNFAGASPDSLTEDAIVEVKCPESTTYLQWLLSGEVPEQHRDQMQWQMACTGRKKGIFIGYDPRQVKAPKIFFRDLARYDKRIAELEAEAQKMDEEIEAAIKELGYPPTEWVIEDGELALPSKHAPETKLNRQLRESMEALDVLDDDWEQIIERRARVVQEGVA